MGIVTSEPALTTTESGDTREDSALLEACLKGDEQAWAALVTRYSRLIYSVALRSGLAEEDAADVFQHVCMTLYEKLGTLRDTARLSGWLITTTSRESWRWRARRTAVPLDEATAAALPDAVLLPEEQAARLEQQQHVHLALSRLPDRCRTLLHALFLRTHELSYQRIAATLGIPVPSIGPTRARCLRKLAQELERTGFTDVEL